VTDKKIEFITKHFDIGPQSIVVKAPGRINLIGEHTDYNQGLVLPAAIDKYLYFALNPNGSNQINAVALDIHEKHSIDLNKLSKTGVVWVDFIIGLLLEFKNRSHKLIGFDCVITSEVPIGSGMSSSSALECAVLTALNSLFNSGYDNWELIEMSQSSNHNFIGVQGGIMDQFASLFGKRDKVMLLDCDTLRFEYISLPKGEYTWMLINTCVEHSLVDSGYNDRVKECQSALASIQAKLPEVKHLSNIPAQVDLDHIQFENDKIKKRALFVRNENERVRSFIKAMDQGDFQTCGALIYQSHEGLSQGYEVSCAELDFLVDALLDNPDVLGSRMMGGGFGGCTINLVKKSAVEEIQSFISKSYFDEWQINPDIYLVSISQGASILNV